MHIWTFPYLSVSPTESSLDTLFSLLSKVLNASVVEVLLVSDTAESQLKTQNRQRVFLPFARESAFFTHSFFPLRTFFSSSHSFGFFFTLSLPLSLFLSLFSLSLSRFRHTFVVPAEKQIYNDFPCAFNFSQVDISKLETCSKFYI